MSVAICFFCCLTCLNVIWARPIKYKHRYPKETSDDVLSSQETLGSQSLAPVTENTDKGEASMASSEKEVIGE